MNGSQWFRCAAGLAVMLAVAGWSTAARAAGSIFDDEEWEDPKIEGKPTPPPATKIEPPAPQPEPQPTPPKPESAPTEPDAPPPPPTKVEPAETVKPSTPPPVKLDVTPQDMIKLVNERIKAAGPQPAKLSDDSMIMLYHQKAVAHAQLGQLPAARDAMAKVTNATKWNRSVILNSARIDVAGKSDAMRAVTNLEKYFKTTPEPDEHALELWGMALATYARNRGRIPEAKELAFVEAQTALERTRTGERRWGNSWLSDTEFRKIDNQRNAAIRAADGIASRIRQAEDRYENYERQSRRNYKIGRANRPDPYYVRLMEETNVEIGNLKKELAVARKNIPRPTWVIPLRMDEPDPKLIPK